MKIYTMKYWLISIATLLLVNSCNEDLSYREPTGTSSGIPQHVTEIQVKNFPGKATISYKLPADPNLLYVQAKYVLANGKEMDVKSSYFVDSLVVEGFADTQEHEIKLYTVNRQEVHSDPISVTVKPLTAPIWSVLESIDIRDAFGGYKLTAVNKTQEAIGILIMETNVFDEWEVDNNLSIYTSIDSVLSQRSGMDTVTRHFAIAVRDRWSNITDTLYKDINPIYEVELNTANFRHFPLPGDPSQQPGAAVSNMWDKRYGWPVSFSSLAAATLNVPSIVTVDMGVSAKLSKVWIRPFMELSNLYYGFTTLKHFELWGSANPNQSGALDESWTLLGKYELKKPSGSSGNTETASDQEAAANGFFYDIDLNAPKIRYLRIRCLVNWAGSCPQSVDELKVFGDPR
ncbi:DUF4959 domain-containing protein [Ohtaekwangia koreensis]|uniref:F5/8 type C domain-containing protein n=1 Tax=Ohtaekwangia koreensis TaxID=688867 RepID=A0A1T5M7G1_9BACT|nr:DUF4959 domain-containing protein [Ohtaekwangia koreensis]SKC83779.1 protein of unknown function [Ohtaekwangia koreensis]